MADQKSLSGLTRSLMIGASVGTVSFVTVGCAEIEAAFTEMSATPNQQSVARTQYAVSSEREGALCEQALRTQSATDVNRLIAEFPSSRCVAPILNAAPSSTLSALSAQALARLDASVVSRLSPRVRAQLPVLQYARGAGGSRY